MRRAEILYWRAATREDVDFVIEAGTALVAVEVTATARPRLDEARHLRTFREEYKGKVRTALLLHTGKRTDWLAPGIVAAPWWKVL
jgi:predicted AAA+ superfamily ATPase